MRLAFLIAGWIAWGGLTAVCAVMVFLMTVFTGDNPANKAAAERLMTVAFVLLLAAIGGGITVMIKWPDWRGWLLACGLTLAVPVVMIVLAGSAMKK